MFTAAVLALALARPTEVFEEWSLLDTTPLREAVTTRAVYLRREGPSALLPVAVQGAEPPTVYAMGHPSALPVTHAAEGWVVTLPSGDRDHVHLVARTVRRIDPPRLFQLQWPHLRAQPVPVRRVATAPRDWMQSAGAGWTCPDEPLDDAPCVSSEPLPPALQLRVPPARSPPRAFSFAFGLPTLALFVAGWREEGRYERLLAALGGVAVAAAVALSLVGARWTSWAVALAITLPTGVVIASLAPRHRSGRVAGGLALLTVPLLAVLDRRVTHVVAVAVLAAMAIVWIGLRRSALAQLCHGRRRSRLVSVKPGLLRVKGHDHGAERSGADGDRGS